ncbi:hypothetical protein DM02DRAFT_362608 [Periconia macrospinosa]|uniref:Ribonuclease H1 N-terminal domain-containing protein n=1 Tax=Periconia macrospinosa TaxID=97972 RepID=A0A2V1DSU6_9PLEO|nr:hypothetical protein DM02DRAFT_362608 [Periconia macrospinosa]
MGKNKRFPYYAVAVGRKPGIYTNWYGPDGCNDQVNGFKSPVFRGFYDTKSAIKYMQNNGVENPTFIAAQPSVKQVSFKPDPSPSFDRGIKPDPSPSFDRGIKPEPSSSFKDDFKPDSSLPFKDDFKRWASSQSQSLNSIPMQKRKVVAIRDELIAYYLPSGVHPDQIDDDGDVNLTKDQTLEAYQAMCKHTGKPEGWTIDECLTALKKQPPYVNIIDLIDACRTRSSPQKFYDWYDFKRYTLAPGNRIPLDEAIRHPFLEPLLQNLNQGPPRNIPVPAPRDSNRPIVGDSYRPMYRVNEPPSPLLTREVDSFSSSMLSPVSDYCSAFSDSDLGDAAFSDFDMEDSAFFDSNIEDELVLQTPIPEDSLHAPATELEPTSSSPLPATKPQSPKKPSFQAVEVEVVYESELESDLRSELESELQSELESEPESPLTSPPPPEVKQSLCATTRSSEASQPIKPEPTLTPPLLDTQQPHSKKRTHEEAIGPETTNSASGPEPVAKRTRAAKVQAAAAPPSTPSQTEPEPSQKRKRGRPPKVKTEQNETPSQTEPEPPQKRKCGRPPKVKTEQNETPKAKTPAPRVKVEQKYGGDIRAFLIKSEQHF